MPRWLALLPLLACCSTLQGAEWFVSREGNDSSAGKSWTSAFATVQRAVDALTPGDTLTIGPGEYPQAVRLEKFGILDRPTTIRARITGTVMLRGDVLLSGFRKVEAMPFTYSVGFDPGLTVQTLNELDTRKILTAKPNARELGFVSGAFHHDRRTGTLYLTSSDWEPAETHEYTASVVAQHGLALIDCTAVVLEGLTVTGFNAAGLVDAREAGGAVFGIYLSRTKSCVVRDCKAYFNGCGIGINTHVSKPEEADKSQATGDNLIERCEAWANAAPVAVGNMGGMTLMEPRRDAIRDCVSYLNAGYGVNISGGQRVGADLVNQSFMTGNVAWGNGEGDIKIKTGFDYIHRADHNVIGQSSIAHRECVAHNLFLGETPPVNPDNIVVANETDLDPKTEFADPDHHDYRLQSTSRFRGTGPGGADRGPFRYSPNVYFVRPDGNDLSDGLSVKNAWRSVTHAAALLKPGDTLYLEGGPWPGDVSLTLRGQADRPVTLRGRGRDRARLEGLVTLRDSHHLVVEDLQIQGGLTLLDAESVAVKKSRIRYVDARRAKGLRITDSELGGSGQACLTLRQCGDVFLRANEYANQDVPAVDVDDVRSVLYSDYNRYTNLAGGWRVGAGGNPPAEKGAVPAPRGAKARSQSRAVARLIVPPKVHSVSATTANIEWMTSAPALCDISWASEGETEQRLTLDALCFGSFSLTGLKPDTSYRFRLLSLREPGATPGLVDSNSLDAPALTWTTSASETAPRTFFVAPRGDDQRDGLDASRAWRTIQHAADSVNVGDTVLVAPGEYRECVRLRATGAPHAPITFRASPDAPGAVILSGAGRSFKNGLIATSKSHLRFDGLYLTDFDKVRPPREFYWNVERPAEFNLYRGRDIHVTRCFSDGRGAAAPEMVLAWHVDDLLIRNCVVTGKNANLTIDQCPRFRLERSVMSSTLINAIVLDNKPDQPAVLESNIFTDNLYKKAALNIGVFAVESPQGLTMKNNALYLRLFPVEERQVFFLVDHATHTGTGITLPEFERRYGSTSSALLEPAFAGVKRFLAEVDQVMAGGTSPVERVARLAALLSEHQQTRGGKPDWWFPPDYLMDASLNLRYDFDGFFTTQPELIQRGVGLDPAAFADMNLAARRGGFLTLESSR